MINVGDILSTVGDIMSTVEGYLEYCGGCSVPWGMFSTVGDVQYRGGCSVPWGDIMMHVGGYHEYRGGSLLLFEYPTVLNTPTVLMVIPHGTQISKDGIPHGTEHPHGTHDIPPWY